MNAITNTEGLFVSYSQVRTFLLCPKKFELHYVVGAQAERLPLALAFGSAFHDGLAMHYRGLQRGQRVPLAEVQQRFIDVMTLAKTGPVPLQLDDEEGQYDEVIAKGLEMLEVTLTHPSAQPEQIVAVEEPFVVDLFDPETGELLDVQLRGVLDLVTEEEGRRYITEHKSAARRYSLEQICNDAQLAAYAYASERMGWGTEIGLRFSVTTKAKKPELQIEPVLRDEKDQLDFLRQVSGVLKSVNAAVNYRVRGWQCRTCQYRTRCESER